MAKTKPVNEIVKRQRVERERLRKAAEGAPNVISLKSRREKRRNRSAPQLINTR